MSHTTVPPSPEDQTDATEVLDPEWLAAPARRSRSRTTLLAVLAVLLVFFGGVEVQKRWGSSDGATGGALPGTLTRPQGVTFGGAPTQQGSSPGGADSTSTSSGGTTTPAVIGTLTRIRGHIWTVKDLGGTTHAVRVTSTTTLTRALDEATAPVATGSHVVVQGTAHGHAVTASAVIVR
jgi:hypothetical protein